MPKNFLFSAHIVARALKRHEKAANLDLRQHIQFKTT